MIPECPCRHCGGSGIEPYQDALILNAVFDAFGCEWFTVADMRNHARLVGGPLRDALAPYNAKSLGNLLTTLEGSRVDDMVLERGGKERNKALRRVRLV